MSGIELHGIEKRFGKVSVLEQLELEIRQGEFLVLLGPSGCGKSTLLRCIAGLEPPDQGLVYLGGRCVFSSHDRIDYPARDREIGMVFQNFALYPHMNVFENVAFGLKVRKLAKDQVARRVREALRMVDLAGFERRKPKHLSGGQQQRVALARTVAARPRYLLFDEPLSSLDPKLRGALRTELRELHRQLGTTSLYVTHDQHEAMVLGDRVAVLQDGAIAQCAPPQRVYHQPATTKVAQFTASPRTNLITGEVHDAGDRLLLIPDRDKFCFLRLDERCRALAGTRVTLHARPEGVSLDPAPGEDDGRLEVVAIMPEGAEAYLHLRFPPEDAVGEAVGTELQHETRLQYGTEPEYAAEPSAGDDSQLVVRVDQAEALRIARGDRVALRFRRGNLYEAESGALLGSFGYDRKELGALDPHAARAVSR